VTEERQEALQTPGINRRGFVGAAALSVGAMWVAPAVITVPASGTAALVNSPPPTTTTTTTSTTTSTTTTTPTSSTTTPTSSTTTTRPTTTTTRPDDGESPIDDEKPPTGGPDDTGPGDGRLPRTGLDIQDPLTVAFGLIAAGGAMQVWSAQRDRLIAASVPVEDQPPAPPADA